MGGALAGAAICSIGGEASTLLHTPPIVAMAYRELFKSDLGPVLKGTLSLLVPPFAVIAQPLALVSGALYGIYSGFKHGYKKGTLNAVDSSLKDIRKYNKALGKLTKK